jgi:hypothetical protein
MRHWGLGFVPGAFLALFGLFMLIGKKAWLGPLGGLAGTVLAYLLAIGGLLVIIDSFFEFSFHSGIGISTLLVGLLVFGLGLVNVLSAAKVLSFSVPVSAVLYHVLFVIEGAMLIIATFVMD